MFSVLAHTTSTKTATLYHKTSQTANRRGKCRALLLAAVHEPLRWQSHHPHHSNPTNGVCPSYPANQHCFSHPHCCNFRYGLAGLAVMTTGFMSPFASNSIRSMQTTRWSRPSLGIGRQTRARPVPHRSIRPRHLVCRQDSRMLRPRLHVLGRKRIEVCLVREPRRSRREHPVHVAVAPYLRVCVPALNYRIRPSGKSHQRRTCGKPDLISAFHCFPPNTFNSAAKSDASEFRKRGGGNTPAQGFRGDRPRFRGDRPCKVS